jgi:SAM-dependent methyltransferase
MVPKTEGILDVGCGNGWLSQKLFNAGYTVACLDRKILCEWVPGIRYIQADLAERIPFDSGSIENITFTEVFEHLKQPYTALHQFSRILRKDGLLFMSIPNYWSIKRRLKYFFTSTIETPIPLIDEEIKRFHQNDSSHINTPPWPMIKFALGAEGFEVVKLTSDNHYSMSNLMTRRPDYLLWYVLIHLYRMLAPKEKRDLLSLDDTASRDILFKGSRIAIIARKVK